MIEGYGIAPKKCFLFLNLSKNFKEELAFEIYAAGSIFCILRLSLEGAPLRLLDRIRKLG